MPLTPSLRHCSNKYKLAREGEKGKEKDEDIYFYFFMMMKSSSVERDEFSIIGSLDAAAYTLGTPPA